MKTIGYINNREDIKDIDNITDKMKKFKCTYIYNEDKNEKDSHPMRHFVLSELSSGDTLVVYALYDLMDNDKDCIDFLRRCVDNNIRIISIFDELDSDEVIYPFTFRKIVKALHEVKNHHPRQDLSDRAHDNSVVMSFGKQGHQDCYRRIINMYAEQLSLEEIAKATGYTSRQVSRILNKYHVQRDRCPIPECKRKYTKPTIRHVNSKET